MKKQKSSLLNTFKEVLATKEKRLIFLYKSAYILRDDNHVSQMEFPSIIFKFKNGNEQLLYVIEGDYLYDNNLTIKENGKIREIFLSSINKTQKSIESLKESIGVLEKEIEDLLS